jgi:uncharacterized protein with HEPN domain
MPRKSETDPLGDQPRLLHMLQAARDAVAFADGKTRADLDRDRMLLRALVNCVQEIGEAASCVTDEGRARAPDVPWPKIVGMRHILVHAYYNIDADALWRVVEQHIPSLVQELNALMTSWGKSAASDTSFPPSPQ